MRQVFKSAAYYGYMTCGNGILLGDLKMNKAVYVITGVIALTLSSTAFAQQGGQRGWMSSMDTDGNGTVEKSEFAAMMDKRFADTDTNNDGISMEEYQARIDADRAARETRRAENAEERTAKRADRTKARFDSMDADNNGTISADEYKASGERMFDRMDRNDDGILNDRRGRGNKDGKSRGPKT